MARYYFDTHDGKLIVDDIGTECGSLSVVRKLALTELADFSNDLGVREREITVQVRDDQNRPVMKAILRLEGVEAS